MDMSIAPWPSILPESPLSACFLASATMRARRVYLKAMASIAIISRPPANSAARNCQPSSTSRTRPSSKTRLVLANSNTIAFPKAAPFRTRPRATATAA